jgi:hypothetical protein
MADIISKEIARKLVAAKQAGALNPEQAAKADQHLQQFKWWHQNVDTTPAEVPKRTRQVRIGREFFVEDDTSPLDPASPEGQRAAEAAAGIDNEGLGFTTRLKLAMSLDDPDIRSQIILNAADDIGLPSPEELPEGMSALFESPITGGQVILLKDKETGKLRQHRVDALGPEFADLADMADPSEVGSIIGGVVGAIQGARKGRPFVGEAAGEAAGRGAGILFETIASEIAGARVSSEDVKQVLVRNLGEGAASVLLSRGMEKGINLGRRIYNASRGKGINEEAFALDEAAVKDALDATASDVEKLREGGGDVDLTIGEATGDVERLTEEASRTSVATSRRRNLNEQRQAENVAGLQRFVDSSLGGKNVYDAERAVDTYKAAAKEHNDRVAAKIDEVGTIKAHNDFTVLPDGSKAPVKLYDIPGKVGGGDGVRTILTTLDDGRKVQMVTRSNLPEDARGLGGAIYRGFLDDAFKHGRVPASDSKLSLDAMRVWNSLEAEGHRFSIGGQDRTIKELVDLDTGRLTTEGKKILESNKEGTSFRLREAQQDPVLVWESGPQDTAKQFLEDTSHRMDRESLEDGLAEVQAKFNQTQADYEASVLEHDNLLGWNADRQISRFTVNNSDRSRLAGDMQRLRMISQRALGRGDAREADKLLADLFRNTGQEDDLTASFADPQIDVRQAIYTMDRLRDIGKKGSPEAARVAGSIESMLRNAKWRARDDMRMDTSAIKASWQDAYGNMRRSEVAAARSGSALMTNKFLAEGYDGSYSNTSVDALEKLLKNGSGGVDSMRQAIDENVFLKGEFRKGLMEVWRKNALPNGVFNSRGHQRFVDTYGDAMDASFGPELRSQMRRAPQRLGQVQSKSQQRLGALRKELAAALKIPVKEAQLNPRLLSYTGIWKSLRRMGPEQRRNVTAILRSEGGPEAVEQMNQVAQREVAGNARKWIDKGDPSGFNEWIDMQETVLADQFGPRYVEDLRLVGRMLERTQRGVRAVSPESQPLWLRVGRSAFGPLSKKQRIATAANFTAHRVLANNALRVISDPAKMRQFKLLNAKNGEWTKGSVAFATRLGLFDGIPLSEDADQRLHEVNELFYGLDREVPEPEGKPAERAVRHKRPPAREVQTVQPGRGTIEERRRAAIAASERDLEDFGG